MKVFLAFPFSGIIDVESGRVREDYYKFLSETREKIILEQHEVFLAHFREQWGDGLMPPEVCTYLDFQEMKNTDLVLAFPGEPISGGVHIELGWASALGKKIILFLKNDYEYSPLVTGLGTVSDIKLVHYKDVEELDITKFIKQYDV